MTRKEKMLIKLTGKSKDQRGIARCLEIIGWNAKGIPCRKYIWITPEIKENAGKIFYALDTKIEKAIDKNKRKEQENA